MFCTTLRRRSSFARAILKLTGPTNLGLKESQIDTHDIEVSIAASADGQTGGTVTCRQLRVLLFSPTAAKDDTIGKTLERIRRFAALTGGEDLAIVFLLESAADGAFVSAKTVNERTAQTSGEEGMVAYSKLQAAMMDNTDIPHVPVLLLPKLDGLAETLKKHIAFLARPKVETAPVAAAFALLQLCTANGPMSRQTAFILSDLFANLRELARACTTVSSAPNSSSPSAKLAGDSSQVISTQASGFEPSTQLSNVGACGKLKQLCDLVGEQECAGIVEFWQEEWTID